VAALISAVVVAAAVASGIYAGVRFLRRRRHVVLNGIHLLLGAVSVETTVVMMRGAPDGTVRPFEPAALVAVAFFALAMLSGFAAPLLAKSFRRSANAMLVAHAAAGLVGLAGFCLWLPAIR
jgi:hypothetical protein